MPSPPRSCSARLHPPLDDQVEGWEGCLSVDNLRGKVWRSSSCRVEALDLRGKPVVLSARGLLSVILQHECDHLIGKLFLDRMRDLTTLAQMAEFRQFWGQGSRSRPRCAGPFSWQSRSAPAWPCGADAQTDPWTSSGPIRKGRRSGRLHADGPGPSGARSLEPGRGKPCGSDDGLDGHALLHGRRGHRQGRLLKAVVSDLAGTWSDETPDDARSPIQAVFPPRRAGRIPGRRPWPSLRDRDHVSARSAGGGLRAFGMTSAFRKRFRTFSRSNDPDPCPGPLGMVPDEAWTALLNAALPSCPPKEADWKASQACPFPLTREYGRGSSKLTVDHQVVRAEGEVSLATAADAGRWTTLRSIGQPDSIPGCPGRRSRQGRRSPWPLRVRSAEVT